jgi:acetaldehyde dehydrogenase (acetylating)
MGIAIFKTKNAKGRILAVRVPGIIKEVFDPTEQKHGAIYLDELKHNVMVIDKMKMVEAFVGLELMDKFNAVSLALSPARGCGIGKASEAIKKIFDDPKSKHVKIIMPSTLSQYYEKEKTIKVIEHFIKRKLKPEELGRIYVFPARNANEHVDSLKKFLGVK